MAATESTHATRSGEARLRSRPDFGRHALNRGIVYGTLTGAVLVTYAMSVVLLRSLLPGDSPYAVALLSTGAAALVALPLRDRLQRTVNRLMYGDRHDPYRAIARLGRLLEATEGAEGVLDTIVVTVAESLRLPYAAIELRNGEQPTIAAAYGSAPSGSELHRLPLVYRGEPVGHLILAPRSPGEKFSAADERLLGDLGRQAGPAAEAVRLTSDLRRSRERLVTAREEERRRLQRDLHDGIGPTLSGALMKMEVARSRLTERPGEADQLLSELAADTRSAIDEVRRLTYDLRPPVLDQLGLAAALREQAASLVGNPGRPLEIEIEAPADLSQLSAAVEVAAYRIALEALTNVARHSGARQATLRVWAIDGELVLDIADDGNGAAERRHAGIGLRSMRERAEELGGSVEVVSVPGEGTRVHATIPLRRTADV